MLDPNEYFNDNKTLKVHRKTLFGVDDFVLYEFTHANRYRLYILHDCEVNPVLKYPRGNVMNMLSYYEQHTLNKLEGMGVCARCRTPIPPDMLAISVLYLAGKENINV